MNTTATPKALTVQDVREHKRNVEIMARAEFAKKRGWDEPTYRVWFRSNELHLRLVRPTQCWLANTGWGALILADDSCDDPGAREYFMLNAKCVGIVVHTHWDFQQSFDFAAANGLLVEPIGPSWYSTSYKGTSVLYTQRRK